MALFERLFPLPKFSQIKAFGLDLSPNGCRYMAYESIPGQIVAYGEAEFSTSPYTDEGKLMPGNSEVVAILEQARDDTHLSHAIISVPEERSYIYELELPRQGKEARQTAVELSIPENIPFSLPEVTYEFKTMYQVSKEVDKAIVTVIEKQYLLDTAAVLAEVGIEVVGANNQSGAVALACVEPDPAPVIKAGADLVVSLFHDKAVVSLMENGVVRYSYTLTEKTLKNTPELSDPMGDMANTMSELVQVIDRVLDYREGHGHTNRTISRLMLHSSGQVTDEFLKLFEARTGVMPVLANPWLNTVYAGYVPPIQREDAGRYAVASGLAKQTHQQ